MLSLHSLPASWAPAAAPVHSSARSSSVTMETKADLVALAEQLNPVVGYWDPLQLADQEFWGTSNEATIGFLRESEIKHGRIAMFGFVGYIVHENDIRTQGDAIAQAVPTGLSAPAVWDALPEIAKWQIILFVGVMEALRENKAVLAGDGEKHYMSGGKPGYFPTFDMVPHPTPLNLFDPFGNMKAKTEESKARGRLVELNNGRLAMIGLFGFLSEATVPGSVPFLKGGLIPEYTGEVMAPFAKNIFTL
uniref:Light harvesting protein n=1 Tax=Haptolina ericina TaxID=156174 RepID=A0A7S3BE27_9EUKA|mmetsp:Transcript_57833/g.129014  ORF Transcript_57833/g.129014 Transcript_57833/m.129014 type:complete len:249 (+) Transcript_57833:23-769(+)